MNFKERFERYFIKSPNSCWIWRGGKIKSGYGTFRLHGEKCEVAHRISYKLYVSEIPDGLLVLHKCDIRDCVNPDHLFIGTHGDNTLDMLQKGRGGHWKNNFKGSMNPNAVLSEKDKDFIEKSLLYKELNQNQLSELFNVRRQTIGAACRERDLIKKYRIGWRKI